MIVIERMIVRVGQPVGGPGVNWTARISRRSYVVAMAVSYLCRFAIAGIVLLIVIAFDARTDEIVTTALTVGVPALIVLAIATSVVPFVRRAHTLGWPVSVAASLYGFYWVAIFALAIAPFREAIVFAAPHEGVIEGLKIVIALVFVLEVLFAVRRAHRFA